MNWETRASFRKLCVLLIGWWLTSSPITGGPPFAEPKKLKRQLWFEHLSLEDGLSQSHVFAILQDSRGFMWFGTENGLNRYDGYRFTVYLQDPEEPASLSENNIRCLFEDRSGRLWIGTVEGGLNRFDPLEEQFFHYRNDPKDVSSLSNNRVWSIGEDGNGILWIGTLGGGLDRFDPESGDV